MMLETFLIGIAANASYGLTAASAKAAVKWLRENKPEIVERLRLAESRDDMAEVRDAFERALGAITAAAGTGTLEIDGASMMALKDIRFDHQSGVIYLRDMSVEAKTLVTGGGEGARGSTTISGDTSLRTAGTEIRMTKGASIKITGNASIKQS